MIWNDKKISIIVPLYNMEKLIERCLISIKDQTYENLEIIVVDDGSTDESAKIAAQIAETDDRIRLISHEKNKGLFHARITGVEQATGDYIGFVDSDDYIADDYYRALLYRSEEIGGADIVVGKIVHEDSNGYRYIHNRYHTHDFGIIRGTDIQDKYWNQIGSCFMWHTVWNKLYSKKIWDKALPILKGQADHLIMCEDFVFSSVLFNYAQTLTSTEYASYYYYQHAGASTSSNGNIKKYKKNIGDLKTSFDFVEKFIDSGEYVIDAKERFIKWKTLYQFFWKGNIDNSGLSTKDKKKLFAELKNFSDYDISNVKDSSYFYDNTVAYDNRYNDIIRKLNQEDIECVSFDIFDTAVVRPFYKPTDLFTILNDTYLALCPKDYRLFSDIRIKAEADVRKEMIYCEKPLVADVSLKDIYDRIKQSIEESVADKMMQAEMDAELRYCTVRKSIYNVYIAALHLEKKVIFTSDMYLPSDLLKKILEKNGYTQYDHLLVSCEENASKSKGTLYKELIKHADCKSEQIIHIGDSWESDVTQANNNGIKSVFYPKTTDCIQYNISDIKSTHTGVCYSEPSRANINYAKAMNFMGTKSAFAVAANKLYDNPFIPFNEWTEMNGDPRFFGYYALGMHLLGFTKWMADSAKEEKYDSIAFVARDGYLPMKAYELIHKYYGNMPEAQYIYTSRKAAMACEINVAEDLLGLIDKMKVSVSTPRKITDIIKPVIDMPDTKEIEAMGFKMDEAFGNADRFTEFITKVIKPVFNVEKSKQYKSAVKDYLSNALTDKAAMVDVGYSGRTQELVYNTIGKPVDAYYLHINDDSVAYRERRCGFKIRSFYDYTPSITGAIRELVFSKLAPSCIGYEMENGKAVPKFERFECEYPLYYLVSEIQQSALQFVEDFCDIFGDKLHCMTMRNIDISLPFEYFLHTLTWEDSKMFACCTFEDDLWAGRPIKLSEQWLRDIAYHKTVPHYKIGGDSTVTYFDFTDSDESLFYHAGMDKKGKFSRALFWFAVDRKKFAKKLKSNMNK